MSAVVGGAVVGGAGGCGGAGGLRGGAGGLIIAANFKCNHTRASYALWAKELGDLLAGAGIKVSPDDCDLAGRSERVSTGGAETADAATGGATGAEFPKIHPYREIAQIIAAPAATAFLAGELPFTQAAQNFYPAQNGAFTGEIGAEQLDEFGVRTVIIGHCERRALGESEEFLARKFAFAAERGWRVIYCIGEDAATYERGERLDFCARQLERIDLGYAGLIVAYEPIYSIGKTAASSADIAEMMAHLRAQTAAPLLYGGSVNASNIASITTLSDASGSSLIDGVLVGSASLKAANFFELIRNAIR